MIHDEEERLLHENPKQIPEPQVERVFMRLYEEKGVRVSKQEAVDAAQVFRSFSLRYVRLYYGAKELLAHLKKKDKKLYVLSNAQQVFTASELRYLGIYDSLIRCACHQITFAGSKPSDVNNALK